MDINSKYFCNNCNKYYKSYHSLYQHNKRYHMSENNKINSSLINCKSKCKSNVNQKDKKCKSNVNQKVKICKSDINTKTIETNINIKVYKCNYCNKEYKYRQSKYKHQKTCKEKTNEDELKLIKEELKELKEHNKNLSNQLISVSKGSNNSNNNIQVNNQQVNINNISLVGYGKEEIERVISNEEQRKILSRKYNSLQELVNIVHLSGKYPQFQNIAIKNLRSKIAYMYDDKSNRFNAVDKLSLLQDIINDKIDNLINFLEYNSSELDQNLINTVERFIEELEENTSLHKKNIDKLNLNIYNNTKNKNLELSLKNFNSTIPITSN